MAQVRVRLVPKTRDGRSINLESTELSTANAKANRPDREKASMAVKMARDLKGARKTRVTYHGSVETTMDAASVERLFNVELEETTAPIVEQEVPAAKRTGKRDPRIDINEATKEQLEGLPGIGAALAERIVEERRTSRFRRLAELRRLPGIGDSLLSELRNMITTGLDSAETMSMPPPRLKPSKPLKVPPKLKDLIAFAYVPTPVEFFAATYIPPDIENYHLRLQDLEIALQASASHHNGWRGHGVRVAMTDTGFAHHPYFDRQGYEIVRASTPSTTDPDVDTNGHGTGESANALLMAPDCVLIGVKHNDYSAEAMETALEHRPDVITNSWGWNIDFQSWADLQAMDPNLYNEARDLENIINDAVVDGVLVVFAAGNGHRAFPGSMPSVLSVGGVSVDRDGALKASSYASSFDSALYPGRKVPDVCGVVGEWTSDPLLPGHIMLPVPVGSALEGENMPGSVTPDGWGVFSGTSAASPQVAGVAAMVQSARHDPHPLSPAEMVELLRETATDVTTGTSANGGTAGAGIDDATGAGLVNAAEACAFAANGPIEATHHSGVDEKWHDISLGRQHGPAVAHFASMQTFNGPDPASVRIHQPTQTGCRVKIEEEQSLDAEVNHLNEKIGHVALRPGMLFDQDAEPIGEVGMFELKQSDPDAWRLVELRRPYDAPVVIARIMTWNGTQPAHTRIRKVTATSFEIQIEEWDYLNGTHPFETISHLVLEAGNHALPAGMRIEAGRIDTDHSWVSVPFTKSYSKAPAVLASCQTVKGPQAIVTRLDAVTKSGFDIRLQEEEAADGIHKKEWIGWAAFQR